MNKLYFLLALLISASHCNSVCADYIAAISTGWANKNVAPLPIPTIMYSGITTNNPGQMYECENKTPPNEPYLYFLIGFTNTTNNVNTFTGVCVPEVCKKQDIEQILVALNIKNAQVYEYTDAPTEGLLIACAVIVFAWLGVLVLWSLYLSFKEPAENELIKKDEEVRTADDRERLNSLVHEQPQKKEDYKLFNFYEGYCRVFQRPSHKHTLGPILFLAAFSIVFSTEFSYRQTIAANITKSFTWFHSLGGVLFCNLEIAFSVVMFVLGAKLAHSLFRLNSFHEIGRYFFDQLLTKWLVLVLTSMAAYLLLSLTDEPLNQIWKNKYGADCPAVMYQIWFLFRNLQLDCKVCMQWFWVLQVDILLTIIAAPLFLIYRTKRAIGYAIFTLAIFISLIFSYGILESQNILFEPYKLFNMAKEFTVNYQTNTLVRVAPYSIGFLLGLFTNEAHENTNNNETELKVVKLIRRSQKIQIVLHILGLSVMILNYLLIIPYLPVVSPGQTRPQAYAYLVFAPFGYLLGLALFLLPCLLQGENKLTVFLNRILSATFWNSLQKMSIGFLLIGPVVIGFTTYSMQNSIYFELEPVFVYFLGDCVIIYVLTLLAVSAFDSQLHTLSKWTQAKVFGNQFKDAVQIVED